MNSHWYSAAQLAAMKLPGLPGSERNMRIHAQAKGYATRQVPSKGGKGGMRTEYQPPKAVLRAIQEQKATEAIAVIAPAPSVSAGQAVPAVQGQPIELDDAQRKCERAREKIAEFVSGYAGSVEKALGFLNAEYVAGRLNDALLLAYENAWDKKRADSKITRSTYNKWLKSFNKRGSYAPLKVHADLSIKPWHALALSLRQRPQGSTLTWIAEQVEAQWDVAAWGKKPLDLYSVIWRFFEHKCSAIDQLKGRYTGSKLRSYKNYTTRTSAGMYPWQEVHADGWNTHCTAPHPVTGEFVTHEVWIFRDVATRFRCPPGIGLTENYDVITKGLENCVRVGGVPVILQTDSTKIIKKSPRFQFIANEAGMTIVHPVEVGNSQANGIAENGNKDLDRACRELATYQAKGMDSLTLKRVKKITAEMVKAANAGDVELRDKKKKEAEKAGKGLVFGGHQEFIDWINAAVDKPNDRPHPALPKIRDEISGKMRHQTPREALNEHRANGWEPVLLAEAHLVDLFRTRVQVKVVRGGVIPYGKMRYTDPELLHWNGKMVVVAYDKMDWKKVWVRTLAGVDICEADFAFSTAYRCQTAYEEGEEKRANAQIKRREKDIERIRNSTPSMVDGKVVAINSDRLGEEAQALFAHELVQQALQNKAEPLDAEVIAFTSKGAMNLAPATPSPAVNPLAGMTNAEKYVLWHEYDAMVKEVGSIDVLACGWQQIFYNGFSDTPIFKGERALVEMKAAMEKERVLL